MTNKLHLLSVRPQKNRQYALPTTKSYHRHATCILSICLKGLKCPLRSSTNAEHNFIYIPAKGLARLGTSSSIMPSSLPSIFQMDSRSNTFIPIGDENPQEIFGLLDDGRMCRLILNAILLEYAGIVVCLGENEESRQE